MHKTGEIQEVMEVFERTVSRYGVRKDREDRSYWTHQQYYKDGLFNELFLAFLSGYAFGKSVFQS